MFTDGKYYVARVIKQASLDTEMLINAILNPITREYGKNAWTFVNVQEFKDNNEHYIYGSLSKFELTGEISKVDTIKHSEFKQLEDNLILASSPFVYIPKHSGIVFLHVNGHINEKSFSKHFCQLIRDKYNVFYTAKIEMISDMETFSQKLESLDIIYKLQAKVSPPNPLYGPLWKPLKDYLKKRNTDNMQIVEDAPIGQEISTDLPKYVKMATSLDNTEENNSLDNFPIGDIAILMAIDGYGNGVIKGKQGNKVMTIKTSETIKTFNFKKDPKPEDLYNEAFEIFEKIKTDRHMQH